MTGSGGGCAGGTLAVVSARWVEIGGEEGVVGERTEQVVDGARVERATDGASARRVADRAPLPGPRIGAAFGWGTDAAELVERGRVGLLRRRRRP
jgi:hypothetical protein